MLSQNEIKYVNALKIKKYRHKYCEFIAEGPKLIKDLIQEGLHVKQIFIDNTLNDDFFSTNKDTKIVPDGDLNKITGLKSAYHAIAIFKIPLFENVHSLNNEWILALDEIQDPGNMGTIIRTADWFGIKRILLSKGCVDPFSPKVVQASMGSIGRIQLVETDLLNEFQKTEGIPIFGGVLDGKSIEKESFAKKGIILIGNEGNGISEPLLPFISNPVTITKIGRAESLNAAISMAIICAKACLES
jgi:TrmH family RNA methyltransferase